MAVDTLGNLLVAGYLIGSMKLLDKAHNTSILLTSAGQNDYFLAKFDSKGDVLWGKTFGDAVDQGATIRVAVDGANNVGIAGTLKGNADFGGGVLTATGKTDIFAAKFDALGNHTWSTHFGASGNFNTGEAIAFDTAGNVLVGGSSIHALNVGLTAFPDTASRDGFVAKLSGLTGSVVWAKQYAEQSGQPVGSQIVGHLATDSANSVFLAGSFSGSIYLNTSTSAISGSTPDGFLAKIASDGTIVWGKTIGTTAGAALHAMTLDSSGNVLLTGYVGAPFVFGSGLPSIEGVFLAKYNPAGFCSQATGIANSFDFAPGLTTDPSNNVYVTQNLDLLATGQVRKFDPTLAPLWSKDYPGFFGAAVGYDKVNSRLDVAAYISSKVDFGTGVLLPAGGGDLTLAQFQP
jgi:hypothetical protein